MVINSQNGPATEIEIDDDLSVTARVIREYHHPRLANAEAVPQWIQ